MLVNVAFWNWNLQWWITSLMSLVFGIKKIYNGFYSSLTTCVNLNQGEEVPLYWKYWLIAVLSSTKSRESNKALIRRSWLTMVHFKWRMVLHWRWMGDCLPSLLDALNSDIAATKLNKSKSSVELGSKNVPMVMSSSFFRLFMIRVVLVFVQTAVGIPCFKKVSKLAQQM